MSNRLILLAVLVFALGVTGRGLGAEEWWSANDAARITRTGEWRWTSFRYAADSALETQQDGAAVEFDFSGRGLALCLDTLTPPNNYGPPQLGALEIFVDGERMMTVRPREAAHEVTLLRSAELRRARVRIVHRADAPGTGARIRGFRVAGEPTGDVAFAVSGEQSRALVDVRATLKRDGQVVRDTLLRNWLTGECRMSALPAGEYTLELRAAGWKTARLENVVVQPGVETRLPAVYLARERDVGQDEFPFPAFGAAAVRLPGGSFRARFEGHRGSIKSARLLRTAGPAILSRRCTFEEDAAAAFYYHREGTVTIPADTPPGTYDLEIALADARGDRVLVSPRAVSVVTGFNADPVFVSWGHLDTWGQYQAEYVERLVAIANLIAADMVLVSNEANAAYSAGALYGLEMPFMINFGNHRGPEPGPWFARSVDAVDFGSAFTVVNFGLPWDRDYSEARRLLEERASTRLRILNTYEANAPVADFYDRHRIHLAHYAHGPGPAANKVGATPTVRVGKSNSESFRVIRFKDGKPVSYTYRGHATAPIPCPRAGPSPLGLAFAAANDGTHRTASARYHNDLEESFPAARAVFVMPRGKYRATGGRIEHTADSDDGRFTVVSVRFDLPPQAKGELQVLPVQ